MTDINLHSIFRHLTGDENFLSKIIESDYGQLDKKRSKKTGCNLMANMVTEYIPLAPYEEQNYALLPPKVKEFLTPNHVRVGIKNVMEKDLTPINISFLNSFNILIRPDIYQLNIDEQLKNLTLLENFVTDAIRRNLQIDKIKNTRKIKLTNKALTEELAVGKITPALIQCLVNIFEINLLIFDLTKMDIYFYWSHGHKYPYVNLFNDIHFMSYVQGNYEPIILLQSSLGEEQRRKIYIQILSNLSEIKCLVQPTLAVHTMVYLNTWKLDIMSFAKIMHLCITKKPNLEEEYNKLAEL